MHAHTKENIMAKAAAKKTVKTARAAKPKKAPASTPLRAAPGKLAKATKAPVAKKVSPKSNIQLKKTCAARAPVISKDELRNQIEKLAAANATLKTKSRETAKALKAAESRIAVLEHQIDQTQAKAAIEDKPTEKVKLPRKTRAPKLVDQPAAKADRDEEADALPELETA
jgi:hypothetical protein